MKKALAMKEPDFQTVADEYARRSLESIREEIDALEHAQECHGGDVTCENCAGSGVIHVKTAKREYDKKCPACKGEGEVKCSAGADSDNPEAWHNEDDARQRITEGPLSVEVRSGWHAPGDQDARPEEYNILLGTGGPAARIVGELSEHGEPESAHFEYQDWWKPWTRARLSGEEEDVLLKYAQQFYFEE